MQGLQTSSGVVWLCGYAGNILGWAGGAANIIRQTTNDKQYHATHDEREVNKMEETAVKLTMKQWGSVLHTLRLTRAYVMHEDISNDVEVAIDRIIGTAFESAKQKGTQSTTRKEGDKDGGN